MAGNNSSIPLITVFGIPHTVEPDTYLGQTPNTVGGTCLRLNISPENLPENGQQLGEYKCVQLTA